MCLSRFAPYENLALTLLPENEETGDGSHDSSHLIRVWNNARTIHAEEAGDAELIAAAVLLHDCINVPKNSPLRRNASSLAAQKARKVLVERLGWSETRAGVVAEAIESHSFSAGIAPKTLEGRFFKMRIAWTLSAWWGSPVAFTLPVG